MDPHIFADPDLDPHIFADPDLDPGSQNVADQADPNYGFYD